MNAKQTQALIESITAQVTAQVLAALSPETTTGCGQCDWCVSGVKGSGTSDCRTPEQAPAEYRVRTDRQKDASHAKIAKVNRAWDMKLAGGSRKVSDLSAAERKAYDAEIRACWTKPAGQKVTR